MTGFNLATYYYPDKRITWSSYLIILLIVIFFSLYNLKSYLAPRQDMLIISTGTARLQKEINLVKLKMNEQVKTRKNNHGTENAEYYKKKVETINSSLEKKGFLWSEFLLSMEDVVPGGVSITKIQPDYAGKKIRMSGFAKSIDDISTLIDNLKNSRYIKKSFLLKESSVLIDNKFPARSFEIESEGTF